MSLPGLFGVTVGTSGVIPGISGTGWFGVVFVGFVGSFGYCGVGASGIGFPDGSTGMILPNLAYVNVTVTLSSPNVPSAFDGTAVK